MGGNEGALEQADLYLEGSISYIEQMYTMS